MRKSILTAAIIALVMQPIVLRADGSMGSWQAYMAYSDIQQICEAGTTLFVRASNSLFQYNTSDQSLQTYDKVNGLSDTYIELIEWNDRARRLVVVYDNSNIDLVAIDGNVTNIADLYSRAMAEDKTVNSITMDGRYAYLATNFGVVKLDVGSAEIAESYMLGAAISRVGVGGGFVYVRTAAGEVRRGALSANLVDRNNWTTTADYPAGIFDADNSATDDNRQLVASLSPGGPAYNYFGYLRFYQGRLYAVNGFSDIENTAALQMLQGDEWTLFENNITAQTGHNFRNLYCLAIDPNDANHVFAGGQTGLYEYRNGAFIREYNNDNSPLRTAVTVGNDNKNYVLVTSLEYGADGRLWVVNSTSPSTSLLTLNPDGTWTDHHDSRLTVSIGNRQGTFEHLEDLAFDSRGIMWLNNNYWNVPAVVRYDVANDQLNVCTNFVNDDGTSLVLTSANSLVEDRHGNIWFGTSSGPLYIEAAEAATATDNFTFIQPKIARDDGSGLADYLLDNITTSAIAIDGADRKWIGTSNNGLYLIDSDNATQIHHFTAENSPLLSDNIRAIAIDQQSGRVYIGTDRGLCSYMADATEPSAEMTKDNVYAYPNPVRPDYRGVVTVVGLSFDADVKITTASGRLVASGRSNGGTFTWDCHDSNGSRVASGVYNVVTAMADGSSGTVCKIAVVN